MGGTGYVGVCENDASPVVPFWACRAFGIGYAKDFSTSHMYAYI